MHSLLTQGMRQAGRTNEQCTHSFGAAQRVHKLATWDGAVTVSLFGYLPTRRAHATWRRGALLASAGNMHA